MDKSTNETETTAQENQEELQESFITDVRRQLSELTTEISQRNEDIQERDDYIYGDRLEKSLDIPVGHDFTPVNWLRRSVEIHKIQFMGRPFQIISTYDNKDATTGANEEDQKRIELENTKQSEFAELRKNTIDAIIRDNGGHALFMDGAESASAIGNWVVKTWYDEDNKKFIISPVEAVENCYALWSKDDFRSYDAFAYVYQISPQMAMDMYGCDDPATSVLGSPLEFVSQTVQSPQLSNQKMVTVVEITGKIQGWGSENGKLKRVPMGKENNLNALCIGNEVYRLEDKEKKLPRYYIFPNKKQRRRAWGSSDISDAAVNINLTYVETLSDWRTVSSKVNFPKFKGFNFGPDVQMPKFKARSVQVLPLGEGQDIIQLNTGDAHQVDFRTQLDELKEQFVRETGISRVLFDDPSITLNSNQALLTSMKPTSDIAESKKQIWGPILQQLFTDAIETIAEYDSTVKDIAADNWNLKIQWPSVMQKEDPVFQQMLLNRFNAGTMSIQTYLENQGETKEEIDRIKSELKDPATAAILGHSLGAIAQHTINASLGIPPWGYVTPKVSLKGELAPQEVGNMAHNYQWDQGPYGPNIGPQGFLGAQANQDTINAGFLNKDGTPNYQPPSNPAQVATPANNQPGTQPVSQPGSGATSTSPAGAVAQTAQNSGK